MSPELLLQYLLASELTPKAFAEAVGITVAELVAAVGGELELSPEVDQRAAELVDAVIRRSELGENEATTLDAPSEPSDRAPSEVLTVRPTIAEYAFAISPGATTLEELAAAVAPLWTLADIEQQYQAVVAIRTRQDALRQNRIS